MQSRSYLFLAIVLLLAGLSGWLYTLRDFNYGLDVRGGIRIVYQLEAPKRTSGQTETVNMVEAQNRVITVLESRAVGEFNLAEPVILPKGEDQIIVELPGVVNIDRAREIMGSTARLEWYHATNVKTRFDNLRPYTGDQNSEDPEEPEVWFQGENPSRTIKPSDPEYAQIIASWQLILEGEDLKNAYAVMLPSGEGAQPHFDFTASGAQKLDTWTRRFFNRGEHIAAVLDGRKVLSLAPLADNTTLSNNAFIQGTFSPAYVRQLSNLLRSGALPVALKEISSSQVDPTIGTFALNQIVSVGVISFGIIALFLVVYYVFPGFIALISLLLYVLLTLTALKWFNATFSLAAIAGFVLSVGMAVDANILVFERVKEEMREGRPLMTSIEMGFNRAFSAILDSNACTIITSFVLSSLGTGPVKGFATTLIIGVAISLFTAVVVTRSLLVFLVGSGLGSNPKWYGLSRSWFGEKFEKEANTNPLKVIQNYKLYFVISVLTILPGAVFLAIGGLKPNVEFRGGFEVQYAVASDVSSASINEKLEQAGIRGANIKFGTGSEVVPSPESTPPPAPTEPPTESPVGTPATPETKTGTDGQTGTTGTPAVAGSTRNLRLAMVTVPPGGPIDLNKTSESKEAIAKALGVPASDFKGFFFVGSAVREETLRNAILGVVLSSLGIVIYLTIRFGIALGGLWVGWRFAASVIGALIHDVLVVIGLAAIVGQLLGWEVSALFISAMLTVIGFSTHDTIVIFDRVRENLRRPIPGEDMAFLMNRSISASFARSINTSATVILTLVLLIAFGSASPDLQLFNAAMLAGIVSGTYSSIFNAAPILYLWDKYVTKRKGEQASMIAIAKQASARVRLTQPSSATPVTSPTAAPAAGNSKASGYGQTRRRRASDLSRPIDEE